MRNTENRIYLNVVGANHSTIMTIVRASFISGNKGRWHSMCVKKRIELSFANKRKLDKGLKPYEIFDEFQYVAEPQSVHIEKITEYNSVRFGLKRQNMAAERKAREIERDFHLSTEPKQVQTYINVIDGVLKKHRDKNTYYIIFTCLPNSKAHSSYYLVGDTSEGEIRIPISFERALEYSTKTNLGIKSPHRTNMSDLEKEVRSINTNSYSPQEEAIVREYCSRLRDTYRIAKLSEIVWVTK